MNKFKESWGQEKMRKNGKYTDTNHYDVRFGNCFNFKDAYLCNPDFIRLLKGTRAEHILTKNSLINSSNSIKTQLSTSAWLF